MTTPDDAALLRAHVDGDPDAFGRLVGRHRDRLWAVAVRTLGDRDEAADALQDALVNAFRRADGFRGDSRVTTWLHRIVVNACLDRVRRSTLRAADPLPEDDHHRELATPPGRDPAEQASLRGDVQAALATLPADQRAAVVLVDMAGYPVEEVAAILECAVGTVKSRCARGRARLAPLLAPGRRPDSGNQATGSPVPPPDDVAAVTPNEGGDGR
ncbi:MAG TPA: RNA polymerase sigma factor SigM [Jiangellales bacterium]|nr:RNA polymerase sigma factor SigM [Jiangellales bacterium]